MRAAETRIEISVTGAPRVGPVGATTLILWLLVKRRKLCAVGSGVGRVLDPRVADRRLIQWLLEHDLVDELELMTVPVILGQGRLFADAGPHRGLELLDSSTNSKGVTIQKFRPQR